MNILQVYRKYQIIPILQAHQLRVASIGFKLADYYPNINKNDVVTSCLLHDMGNILKIDFDSPLSQQTLTEKQRIEGQLIKNSFQAKYGDDEHEATLAIIKELPVSQKVQDIVQAICFTKIVSDDFLKFPVEHLICEYSDMRVDPYGITTLEQRLKDLEVRYKKRFPNPEHRENRKKFAQVMQKVEEKLFEQIDLDPEMLTNQTLNDTIEHLKTFKI